MGWEKLDDVVTVKELADFLKINVETVKRALQSGKLKGFKVGNEWRMLQRQQQQQQHQIHLLRPLSRHQVL